MTDPVKMPEDFTKRVCVMEGLNKNSVVKFEGHKFCIVLRVQNFWRGRSWKKFSRISLAYIYGIYVAGDTGCTHTGCTHIDIRDIVQFTVLSREDLPLLISEKYTSDLLPDLIQGIGVMYEPESETKDE